MRWRDMWLIYACAASLILAMAITGIFTGRWQ